MAAVSEKITYDRIDQASALNGLAIMGSVHEEGATIVLLGPGTSFWDMFNSSDIGQDGLADPVDRWSYRVISRLANLLNAEALFPFGGPPYQPFLRWALDSGRCWQSPVGMLVHDTMGMMVSFRGALKFHGMLELPSTPDASPCKSCSDKPCTSSCPVSALSSEYFYKIDDCHAFLDSDAGQDCMTNGCKARRACPVSQKSGRTEEQSAHHMKYFHPK